MDLPSRGIGAHKPQDAAVAVVELRVVFRKGLDCVVVKKIRVVVEEVLILRVVLLCQPDASALREALLCVCAPFGAETAPITTASAITTSVIVMATLFF